MIKEGDVVTLKSGSPIMTVGKIDWRKKANVYLWHTEVSRYVYEGRERVSTYENIRNYTFPVAALTKVV